jgi:transposase
LLAACCCRSVKPPHQKPRVKGKVEAAVKYEKKDKQQER